ncbi:unnamed protein product, partial [Arabidopsis halleri]
MLSPLLRVKPGEALAVRASLKETWSRNILAVHINRRCSSCNGLVSFIPENEEGCIVFTPNVHYIGNLESRIPGLDSSAPHDVLSETLVTYVLSSTNLEAPNKNQMASLRVKLFVKVIPSVYVENFL